MRIAISTRGFEWTGGVELLRHFVNALLAVRSDYPAELHLLLPEDNHIGSMRDLRAFGLKAIRSTVWDRTLTLPKRRQRWDPSVADFFSQISESSVQSHVYENSDGGLARCLRRLAIDVVFPIKETLGSGFSTPWVGYIPDFQHRYLTRLFSQRECFDREVQFASVLRDAPITVVNARAVREDILRFYPWTQVDRILPLPFAPSALAAWFEPLPPHELAAYERPQTYFIISNQFWMHKDHPTAIRALAEVVRHEEFADVGLLCTGSLQDYRQSSYPQEIRDLIGTLGLARHVQLLGMVPKRHQIELMKGAVASVQPTLFEGGPGGGSTYDAVALGVPVILSDLPVNREIVSSDALFFEPSNAQALAHCMIERLRSKRQDQKSEQLVLQGEKMKTELGLTLMACLTSTAATSRSRTHG